MKHNTAECSNFDLFSGSLTFCGLSKGGDVYLKREGTLIIDGLFFCCHAHNVHFLLNVPFAFNKSEPEKIVAYVLYNKCGLTFCKI